MADATLATAVVVTTDGKRKLYVDAARGGALLVMLLTPTFGPPGSYPFLRHSPWDGLTLSDFFFPAFMVFSGVSLWFLIRRGWTPDVVRRLVKRFVALVVIGLLYNAWETGADLTTLRFSGVLQTIAVSGALGAIVVWLSRGDRRVVATVAVAIPSVWGVLVSRSCVDRCSPMFWLDQSLVNDQHLYRQGTVGVDPEGIGQMLVAVSFVLVGWLAATLIEVDRDRRAAWRLTGGLLLVGVAIGLFDDPNKRLATPSYVALTAGSAVAFLLVCQIAEAHPVGRRADATLAVLGQNALVVYLGERVLTGALKHTTVDGQPAHVWLADALGLSPPREGIVIGLLVLAALYSMALLMKALGWRVAL